MAEVIKIVLTGGAYAGKTTALHFLKSELERMNIKTYVLENVVEKLISSGVNPEKLGDYEFYKQVFKVQLKEESLLVKKAASNNDEKAVILLDGGLLDCKAYVACEDFEKYIDENNKNEDILRYSYDAVFYLRSSAGDKNTDEELLSIWTGTPHLRVIPCCDSIDIKLSLLLSEVKGFLGEPEPLEIERKFLIEYPDIDYLNKLKACRRVPMTQAYLNTPEEGMFRIRKRGSGNNAVYIKTVKIKINDLKRIEKETYLTESEYNNYLLRKEYITGIISKDRYCIVDDDSYYELDVYPFWKDRATLEIELLSENQPYKLPTFVKLIREVSHEYDYRNVSLAQKM